MTELTINMLKASIPSPIKSEKKIVAKKTIEGARMIIGHGTLYKGSVDTCYGYIKELQTALIQYEQKRVKIQG